MSLEQRKQELIAKRAKLAELKKAREQRDHSTSKRDSLLPSATDTGTNTPSRNPEARRELDDLINKLVDKPGLLSRENSPAGRAGSRPSSVGGLGSLSPGSTDERIPRTPPPKESAVYTTSQATQTVPNGEAYTDPTREIAQIAGPAPAEQILSYDATTQTTGPWGGESGYSDDEETFSVTRSPKTQKRFSRREKEKEEELRQKIRKEIEEELKSLTDPALSNEPDKPGLPEPAVSQQSFFSRALTTEEMNAVVSSDDFLHFVNRSSKVIERALDEKYDVLADYALVTEENDDEDDNAANGFGGARSRKGRRLKEIAQFYDERWCKKRMISDINFSPKFPELILTSYTKNPSAPQDPSGLLQVWNLHLHSRPEYTFHSTSDILTAKFSPFHPSLIVGGCYSGQVALWDTRSKSTQPVQKTRLSGANSGGHTHPVYSVDIVGTQNANNIISCSTDGVVCAWSVDMLAQPQEYLELTNPHPGRTDEVSPTCAGFPPSDPTSFLIGTEEGTVYPCHRYDRAGARAGLDQDLRYKGHTAPVMSLNFHSARGPVDLSDLVLTSSLDWTIKLWKVRPFGSSSRANAKAASGQYTTGSDVAGESMQCVAEFPREDVVYDARWAPQRPGIFAAVDGTGSVEVWDLLADTEIPVAKASPSSGSSTNGLSGMYGLRSLNKVAWDEKDGKRLAVGGAAGVVTAYEVGSDLAGDSAKAEEWATTKKLIGKMERGLR